MEDVKLSIAENNKGNFYILEGEEKLGEMEISITENVLTVHHTEILPKAEGKGLAKSLLHAMADYARKQNLQVQPLCTYVQAQFKRNADIYNDIWADNSDDPNLQS